MPGERLSATQRWVIVGAALNGTLYLAYLALAATPLGHRGAMTATYVAGLGAGYVLNRGWSFRHRGAVAASLPRYVALYAAGYALNLAALAIAVDGYGAPHAMVQAIAIPSLALFFLFAQARWVFAPDRSPAGPAS
jgi:putative flippase GtrA